MKNQPLNLRVLRLLLAAGLSLLVGRSLLAAGLPPKLPSEILLAEIKPTPYAERAALRAKLADAETHFGDKLPEWEAKKNALPEKERAAADLTFKRLSAARVVLEQKIDAVDHADAITWESAKSDLYTLMQNTIAIYRTLQGQFDA